MKYLITGANGFLAKELKDYWSTTDIELTTITRQQVDLTNSEAVKNYFANNKFDVVVHTAVRGGRRGDPNSINQLFDNLKMFDNLLAAQESYKFLFNFGSGAEFDRRNPVDNCPESSVHTATPLDYYGLSKNLITKKILEMNENVYNLRLFGCFGPHEEEQRLLKNSFRRTQSNNQPIVYQDKKMDYFFSHDVARVIDAVVLAGDKQINKDINLCYDHKYLLSELVEMMTGVRPHIELSHLSGPYTGQNDRLKSMRVKLIGLEEGIKICKQNWSKSLS